MHVSSKVRNGVLGVGMMATLAGVAVVTAGPAAAVPQPTWGRPCPGGDRDLITGGLQVKVWSFSHETSISRRCVYHVKICNNGVVGWCVTQQNESFIKRS